MSFAALGTGECCEGPNREHRHGAGSDVQAWVEIRVRLDLLAEVARFTDDPYALLAERLRAKAGALALSGHPSSTVMSGRDWIIVLVIAVVVIGFVVPLVLSR